MVSRGFHVKWAGTSQVVQKSLREEVTCPDEENTLRFSKDRKNAEDQIAPESTKPVHFSFFNVDLQAILNTYKSKAAITIQRFFRLKKSKKLAGLLLKALKPLLNARLLYLLHNNFTVISKKHLAALKIQRAWKSFNAKRIQSYCSTPKRKLLAQTIQIGNTLKKVDMLILAFNRNRVIYSPESQSALTPVKKQSLLFKNRADIRSVRRTSTFTAILKDIISDEPNLSCETVPEIAFENLVFAAMEAEAKEAVEEVSKSRLLMKKVVKVRTKRVKRMKIDEIINSYEKDLETFNSFVRCGKEGNLPVITNESEFLKIKDSEIAQLKSKLNQEYMALTHK